MNSWYLTGARDSETAETGEAAEAVNMLSITMGGGVIMEGD